MKSATTITPPSTGLSGILLLSEPQSPDGPEPAKCKLSKIDSDIGHYIGFRTYRIWAKVSYKPCADPESFFQRRSNFENIFFIFLVK